MVWMMRSWSWGVIVMDKRFPDFHGGRRPVKKGAFPAKTVKAPDAVWGLVMGMSGCR
jgi:hypothetical protein